MPSNAVLEVDVARTTSWADRVERDFSRNVLAAVGFDAFWSIGMAFAMISVLVPSYLRELASPKVLIGVTTSLSVLMVPLQLFSDRLLGGAHRKRNVCLSYGACSASFIVYALFSMALPDGWRWVRIGAFVLMVAVFWVTNTLAAPIYWAILTDNCPVRGRGRLYGYRTAALGTVGLCSLLLSRSVLARVEGLGRYNLAMLIAGVIYVLSCLTPMLMRDNIDPSRLRPARASTPRKLFGHTMRTLRELWYTPNYRIFIFFAVLVSACASLGPFIITFPRDVLHLDGNLPMRFQMVSFLGSVGAGVFIGTVADRFGYRITMLLAAGMGLLAYGVAQSAHALPAAMAAYGMNVVVGSSMLVVLCNFSVELMPRHSPADLTAAANLFALPVSTLTPWLCGSVLDLAMATGAPSAGYHIVFTVALVLALIGALGTALLMQEPRSGRVYVIKALERS